LGNHADLRRETFWRNFKLGFFEGLFGEPRVSIEEGGLIVVVLGEFWGLLSCNVGGGPDG
jgi:hypothetical protein